VYNKAVGNIYTGSLYLSLVSLLEQAETLAAGSRIGLFSYGSGAVGEFFVGEIQTNYKDYLLKDFHTDLLDNRTKLTIPEYEHILSHPVAVDEAGNAAVDTNQVTQDDFVFAGLADHRRQYHKANNSDQ